MELVRAQPLLNEADSLAKVDAFDIPLNDVAGWACKCWKAICCRRAYAGEASQHLDAALAICVMRWTIRRCTLPIRVTGHASICDVVSNTLTAEPSRFTRCGR
ncbi:hypothetical protein ACNKHU_21085 [Shigella flexneri]